MRAGRVAHSRTARLAQLADSVLARRRNREGIKASGLKRGGNQGAGFELDFVAIGPWAAAVDHQEV